MSEKRRDKTERLEKSLGMKPGQLDGILRSELVRHIVEALEAQAAVEAHQRRTASDGFE